jgi:AAA family ATP:ADP antiporter
VTVLLLALNVFLFFLAYYLARVLREPLILTGGGDTLSGAQIKAYTAAGQVVLLAAIVPLYGALAGRVPRRRLFNVVTAIFVVSLGGFFLVARTGLDVGIPFYIFVGIFSVMIVAQFWAFANDVYTEEEGKRLFPIVGFGASAGAIAGGAIASQAIGPLGLNALFLLSAIVLVLATFVTNVIDVRERRRTEAAVPDAMTSGLLPAATGQFRAATGDFKTVAESEKYQLETGSSLRAIKRGQSLEDVEREEVESTGSAFALVFRSRYLLLIAMLVMILNWVNTNGGFMLDDLVERTANVAVANAEGDLTAKEFIGAFYARFFLVVNVATLLIQAFAVSRIIKYFGVKGALLFLPIIALGAYTVLAFIPILSVVRWAKTAENSTDYSLNNTVRNVLFLPTTREEKYKGKQVTDAFFQRAGDLLSSATVFVATGLLAFNGLDLVYLNLVLVLVWIVIAVMLGRQYGRLAAATETASVTT